MTWSSGCRKLGTTPFRAASTSQDAFSMNQPARRNATGTGNLRNVSSVIFELLRRLGSATCAPTVERKTTLPGRPLALPHRELSRRLLRPPSRGPLRLLGRGNAPVGWRLRYIGAQRNDGRVGGHDSLLQRPNPRGTKVLTKAANENPISIAFDIENNS